MTTAQPQAVNMFLWTQNERGSGEKIIILPDSRKPFRCGLCSVPFSMCKELVVHVKAHFVNKPYQCGYCDTSYTSSFDLLVHVKSHKFLLLASSDTATNTNSVSNQEKNAIVFDQQHLEGTDHELVAGRKGAKCGTVNTFYDTETVPTTHEQAVDSGRLSTSAEQKQPAVGDRDDDADCGGEDDCHENESLREGGSDQLSAAAPVKQEILENQNQSHQTIESSAELLPQLECLQRPQSTIQRCLESQNQTAVSAVCKCGECGSLFSSTSDLTLHWRCCHSVCSACGESFPDPLLLQYHLTKFAHGKQKASLPYRPFLCELCGADFLLSRHIQAHIKSFHVIQCEKPSTSKSTVLCNGNQKVEDSPNDSLTHAVNIQDILVSVGDSLKKRKCPICSECVSLSELETHVNTVHVLDGHFKCPVCEKSFGKWRGLRDHHKIYHADPNKRFQCPHCSKIFRASYNLKVHIDQVHNPDYRPYECKECGKTFKRHHHLRDHTEARHSSVRPYVCPKCEHPHKSQKSLRSHLKFCKTTVKSGECSSQKRTSTKKQDRSAKHRKLKQENAGDMCHLCGKVVKGLSRHLAMVHSDEKPHKCGLCDRAYKTKRMLQIHTRTHTKEKPFVCEICGKSFALKNTLQYHKNSHTNARPYLCQYCGAGFNNHAALMTHRRGHTGDKRYSCELCGFKFVTKSRLQRHALTHTDKRPWACDMCDKTYRSQSTLRYHERHSHKKSI